MTNAPSPATSLRTILHCADFARFVREERNYAALLYWGLQDNENCQAFLRLIYDEIPKIDDAYFGIYFEYAHLRDAWNYAPDNDSRWQAIRRAIEIIAAQRLPTLADFWQSAQELIRRLEQQYQECAARRDFLEFNSCFVKRPSNQKHRSNQVQSPQTWQPKCVMTNDVFNGLSHTTRHALVLLSWCSRVKPDIVFHLNNCQAVCVELKVETGEGAYTLPPMRFCPSFSMLQTEVHNVMMNILELETRHVGVAKRSDAKFRNVHKNVCWDQLFGKSGVINMKNAQPFVGKMIEGLLN